MLATNIHILTNIHPFRFNNTHTEVFQTVMIQQQLIWNDYLLILVPFHHLHLSEKKTFDRMCETLFYTMLSEKVWIYEFEFFKI